VRDTVGAGYQALWALGAPIQTLGSAPGSTLLAPPSSHALTDSLVSTRLVQLLAGHLALQRGLDPDSPPLLSKATQTR
jgi:glutamine---fructose-6-phosphate transaminase (isomerizing)